MMEPGKQGAAAGSPALAGPTSSLTVSWPDLAMVALCAGCFAAWTWFVTGTRSLSVPAICTAACVTFYLAGGIVSRWRDLCAGIVFDVPLRLLVGYAVVNTALFALVWLSPLSLRIGFWLVAAAAVLGFLAMRPRFERGAKADALPAFLCCAVSLGAATLWAQDCLRPTQAAGEATIFKPWLDSFVHAILVRAFSVAQGAGSIEDFQMAFTPAKFYHFAPYMTPALVKTFSPITGLGAYLALMVPMGVFFTGLAAYGLVSSWWGPWPGLASAMALLLLPDGAQQGFHNTLLSYHFMQIVGPAGMYGTSLLGLAWLFMHRGCAAGRRLQVAASWAIAALSLLYKAHLFVANAFLLWVFPAVFLRGVALRKRLIWLGFSFATFYAGVALGNRLPGIPTLRLDGSATKDFLLGFIFPSTRTGVVRDVFAPALVPQASSLQILATGSLLLVASTFGALTVAYLALAILLRRRVELPVLLLPALFVLNFLVMALGLAFDSRGIAWREELLHRPFVWPYFLLAAWVGGALSLVAAGTPPRERLTKALSMVGAVVFMVVPAVLGSGVQRMWPWSFAERPVPTALIQAAEFVRGHSDARDVVQDARYDPNVVFSALSERRAYVIRSFWASMRTDVRVEGRVGQVDALRLLDDASEIAVATRRMKIRWFLLQPGDSVSWPESILAHPAFESAGYRIYRFD
jgi:hypothetical protein